MGHRGCRRGCECVLARSTGTRASKCAGEKNAVAAGPAALPAASVGVVKSVAGGAREQPAGSRAQLDNTLVGRRDHSRTASSRACRGRERECSRLRVAARLHYSILSLLALLFTSIAAKQLQGHNRYAAHVPTGHRHCARADHSTAQHSPPAWRWQAVL